MLRARFFDDWRLSRIDEEVERLSVNSDTSVAVETASTPLQATQRSASVEGVVQSEDDDDEPPLPPPPSPLPTTKKNVEFDVERQLYSLDEETEALRFLQVKYDTLGKVKVEKRLTTSTLSTTSRPDADKTTAGAGQLQCRTNCDCSLASPSDERPRTAVDTTSSVPQPQSSVPSQSVVSARRKPPPVPSTNRSECRCTSSSETFDHSHSSVVDYRHDCHHRYHCHHGYPQQQQQQPEQQRCNQKSVSSVGRQSQRHQDSSDGSHQGSLCSCHSDQLRRDSGSSEPCCSLLSNAELFQIDLFYRSRSTFVYVCPCPAVLYFARAAGGGSASSWRFAAAGVPVVVADTVRVAVGPRLHVVLAERGTGFELWRYDLSAAQQYVVGETSSTGGDDDGVATAFHTVTLPSGDVAGLCFDDFTSAGEFHRQLLKLDELYLTGGTGSRSRKGKKTSTTYREKPSGARVM